MSSSSEADAEERTGTAGVPDVVRILLEDRRKRDDELAEERARRDEEQTRLTKRMEEQLDMMRRLVEGTTRRDGDRSTGSSESRDKLVLSKFAEGDDIEAYLTTFERMMTVYGVDESRWAIKLAPQLTGRAQQAYAAMSSTDAGAYQKVKKAIFRRYDINEETYRQRFRTARLKEGEAYTELATRLEDLAKKWTADCDTVHAVIEKVVVEQLLNTMPRDLRIWMCERKPTTGKEVGVLADDYVLARSRSRVEPPKQDKTKGGATQETRKCHSCGLEGHLARNCTKKDRGQPNEPEPKEKPKEKSPRDRTERRCYNCHQRGHIAIHCPGANYCEDVSSTGRQVGGDQGVVVGELGGGDRDVVGSGCEVVQGDGGMGEAGQGYSTGCEVVRDAGGVGRAGIMETNCLLEDRSMKRRGMVEGTEVHDMVIDTGCSRTMVRQNLVPDNKMKAGEDIMVRCAHGDIVKYPLADVELDIDGVAVTVTAAVSERLPVSALLGTDIPGLVGFLHPDAPTDSGSDALVVTRAKAKELANAEASQQRKEEQDGVHPNPLLDVPTVSPPSHMAFLPEDPLLGREWTDDMFEQPRDKPRQSRREKREVRHRHGLVRAKDKKQTGVPNFPPEVLRRDLQQMQESDHSLEVVRKMVSDASEPSAPRVFWEGGLLYRQGKPRGASKLEESGVAQLVLPKDCRRRVLELAHTVPLAGHLGKKKTLARVSRRFYWPTMHKDVADFCRSCGTCQKFQRRKVPRAPLIPLPVIDEPFSRVAMDIVGPLPRSCSGNRYVLVLCDYSTRYPEAIPLRAIDAETIALELVKIFSRVGIPQEILTDQGSNFQSQLLKELYRLLHINALRTSPYHPQTDGLVERFNQTLKSMLRKVATDNGKDWDKLIPPLLFAYREVPQESTGFSPFELLYGRDVRGPLDVLKESWEAERRSDLNVIAYITLMRERLEEMSEHVHKNMQSAQTRQKSWYDKNARERSFQPGDQVLVLLPTSTSKLTAQWQGPYTVVERVGKVNYRIRMPDRRKKQTVFHVNMLRKWHTPAAAGFTTTCVPTDKEVDDIPSWNDAEGGRASVGSQLTPAQCQELGSLLAKFEPLFQTLPGHTSIAEHRISTGDATPVRLSPYRIPHAFRETVHRELKEMLEHGVIEHSNSDWAAPLVTVQKKDQTLRLCVDYRRLNALSKSDAYPMPRVDELIDRVGGAKYVSTLDLTKGYWQVSVAESDREKTAFTTPYGLFQFKRMPFGLKGAPATFQRMVDKLLNGMSDFASAYIDHVIVFSSNWKDHMSHLGAVLKRIQEAGLTVKRKKCQFAMPECVYLGHVVGSGRVSPEEAKVQAVRDFDTPKTKTQVRSFLGIAGYYRRFIPHYAALALPLTDLARKSQHNKVVWTPECAQAFEQLKTALCTTPVLKSPEFDKPFILQTDASDRGVGVVLSQVGNDGQDQPVAYYSRKLLPREERYSTVEKECLAIKLSIQAFHPYLMGRTFSIQTDHRSLEWLNRIRDNNARLTRWSLFLQGYSYAVEYRTGRKNGNADALSRMW